ncbi:MAG: CsiV family protein [Thalassotalea sp.]
MKLTRCLTLFSSVLFAVSQPVSAEKAPIRWFEMEVILFNQLSDKTQLAEHFDNKSKMPKYRKIRDLLSPYLYPDVSLLRQQLPVCGQEAKPLFTPVSLPKLYSIKELAELSADLTDTTNEAVVNNSTGLLTDKAELDFITKTNDESGTINPNDISNNSEENTFIEASTLTLAQQMAAELSQQALLAEIEAQFSPQVYQYQSLEFSSIPCRLSAANLAVLKADDPSFNENNFELSDIPSTIDAIETPLSDAPYLISAESLELHDIVKQLRLSKEFKPLLHIGWRQSEPAINKKRSIPMRIFAGENLQQHYQLQLEKYQQDLARLNAQESALQSVLFSNRDNIETAAGLQQSALQSLLLSLENLSDDPTQLIAETKLLGESASQQHILQPPIKPEQNWQLEGLFNVHLNHYLYITADFNIADTTIADNASKALAKGEPQPFKSIRFSQNRRVISSEIHYFDHPHMGMIVQIRRFKKPTAAELASADNE